MLNICGIPVEFISIVNNGIDQYHIEFYIHPTQSKPEWIPESSMYHGCRSFGAAHIGETKRFDSSKEAYFYIKKEYGKYGISLLVDKNFDAIGNLAIKKFEND